MEKSPEKKSDIVKSLSGFLKSSRLAVYLLIGLGLSGLAGTILPQRGTGLSETQFLELSQSPGLLGLAARLGLLDVFHSTWFLALVAALGVNLIFCTTTLLGRIQKIRRTRASVTFSDLIRRLPRRRTFKAEDLGEEKIFKITLTILLGSINIFS